MTSATADTALDVLKTRLKATWMDGNYDYFSRFMASSAAQFLDPLTLSPGATLLDVACGSGQVALVAAERGLKVTGVDIATNLILAARGRAAAAGLDVRFDEGDAEALPYPDATFDVVASLFGAMFAPRPERVAAELLRVCRPGGIVSMGNWTKEGFVGAMFKTFARFLMPPDMPSPLLWGDEGVVRERFGAGVSDSQAHPRPLSVRLPVRTGGRRRVLPRILRSSDPGLRDARRSRAGGASRRAGAAVERSQHRDRRPDARRWMPSISKSSGRAHD